MLFSRAMLVQYIIALSMATMALAISVNRENLEMLRRDEVDTPTEVEADNSAVATPDLWF